MAIQFTQIPSNIRVPGSYIEIDSSAAGQNSGANQRILVIGQRRSTGTVTALTPTLITSYNQAISSFGAGSMLANMFKTIFDNNSETEKWAIALDDVGGGTAATGSITVVTTTVLAGTLYVYLGGVLVSVSVAAGDTDETIATALAAAINANTELPVTAAVDGTDAEKVNLTFRHKGLVGNKYDIRANYRGANAGEVLPGGVTLTIVQLAGGATDPEIDDAFAVTPDEVFDYVIMPYIGTANLNFADTEMNSRWGATRMLEGHVFVADKGSTGTISTLGNTRNSQHMSLFDAGLNSPTPPYIWVSALGAQVAKYASVDPAAPFNQIELVDVLAPPAANRRTQSERNTLLYDGVATHFVGTDGKVYIERLTTTSQVSGVNLPDATYLDANTVFTLATLRQSLKARMASRFPRFKLADNDALTTPGGQTITPKGIRAEIVALAQEWAANGWIENLPSFITTLVVERDVNDPTRVNCVLQPNLVNQLQIFAAQIQFTL